MTHWPWFTEPHTYMSFHHSQDTPVGLSDSLKEALKRKDDQIVAMNQHLQRLQVGLCSL